MQKWSIYSDGDGRNQDAFPETSGIGIKPVAREQQNCPSSDDVPFLISRA